MFDLNEFLKKLDRVYAENPKELEDFLMAGFTEAKRSDDDASALTILNELIGYYRVMSRPKECRSCISQAMDIADGMGLQGTVNYGTTLLNIGTAQRVMGEMKEAEEQYNKVYAIYSKEFTEPDYRMATLYNNRSILYAETGRLKEARQDLEAAMELIQALEQSETEIAITHVNTGNICFEMQDIEEGTRHMEEAVRIFEQTEGKKDPHYASALSGLGEAYFRSSRLEESVHCYEKALEEIMSNYGENDYYRVTKRNLELVKDTRNRAEVIQRQNVKGMDISRKYYETYGKPLIEGKYPEYKDRIAAGLVGEGSECMGYDDGYSTDHDFGPGFCLWLTREDYEAIGKQLQEDYEKLPGEFMGFPARNTTQQGGGRVGVFCMDDFYRRFTGYASAPDEKEKLGEARWAAIDPAALGMVTNGKVFADTLGEFTRRRKEFAAYPEGVRIRKLGQALGMMAQAGQYNYGRMCKRSDREAAYLCKAEFINAAISAGYLMNGIYEPFYKWKIRGMSRFTCLTDLKQELSALMKIDLDEESGETVRQIETICNLFVQELNRQGVTKSKEGFLELQKQELLEGRRKRMKEQLVDRIVKKEWEQFQNVKNEGGRADCQDNWETFEIMRKSQFLAWDQEILESYLQDLQVAEKNNWNLLTEKYARMMESTAPEQFEEIKGRLPVRSRQRMQAQEEMIAMQIRWEEEFARRYPNVIGRGRRLRTSEDTPWDTSIETYARGELGTYSDRTIELLGNMYRRMEQDGENLPGKILENTVHFYGYPSLERAEERFSDIC